mmetsp:Transcript_19809/g.50321  ORF Transcript_19809/g.50321 Transcript_19809/m.50321 type:complete len:897 (-) Transcript_19809:145-2835(-)
MNPEAFAPAGAAEGNAVEDEELELFGTSVVAGGPLVGHDTPLMHDNNGGADDEDDQDWEPGTDDDSSPEGTFSESSSTTLPSMIGRDNEAAESDWVRLHRLVFGPLDELEQFAQSSDVSVLRVRDRLGYTALHVALSAGLADAAAVLLTADREGAQLQTGSSQDICQGSSQGLSPLHLALTTAVPAIPPVNADPRRCVELVLRCLPPEKIDMPDSFGKTALHYACSAGSLHIIDLLLKASASANCVDHSGQYPIHCAVDGRSPACVEIVGCAMDASGYSGGGDHRATPLYRCIERSAWDCAHALLLLDWPRTEEENLFLAQEVESRQVMDEWAFVLDNLKTNEDEPKPTSSVDFDGFLEKLALSDSKKMLSTGIVTDCRCLLHRGIPEVTDDPWLRQYLMTRYQEQPSRWEVLCGPSGILRAFEFEKSYFAEQSDIAPLCDLLRVHELQYIRSIEHKVGEVARESNGGTTKSFFLTQRAVDSGDTKVSAGSWEAARRAAGCVVQGVDLVCNDHCRNAFCAVRPPGHHVGPAGAVDGDLDDDPDGSQGFCLLNNIAIGAAYARCVYRNAVRKVAIVDFDVHHGNGTEAIIRNLGRTSRQVVIDEVWLKGSFSAPAYSGWVDPASDEDSVFFASVHAYGNSVYPHSGADCDDARPRIVNLTMAPGEGSRKFRDLCSSNLLPKLKEFSPDLIFVSAGFDAHSKDTVGMCALSTEDFAWITTQLVRIANACCHGRIVSVLEGGYNTVGGPFSALAQSVAAHVRALMWESPSCDLLDFGDAAVDNGHPAAGDDSTGEASPGAALNGSPPVQELEVLLEDGADVLAEQSCEGGNLESPAPIADLWETPADQAAAAEGVSNDCAPATEIEALASKRLRDASDSEGEQAKRARIAGDQLPEDVS